MSARPCEALAIPQSDIPPANLSEWWARVKALGGRRCGKPAAYNGGVAFGSYCEDCAPFYARAYLDPNTAINVLAFPNGLPPERAALRVTDVLARWRIQ